MDDFDARRAAHNTNTDRLGSRSTLAERPDRIALWAVVMAVVAMIAGLISSHATAASGGVSGNGGTGAGPGSSRQDPSCPGTELGKRKLELGDCGSDVETLNWILAAKDYGQPPLAERFEGSTKNAVRAFQRDADLGTDGVVGDSTSSALVQAMPEQGATWYGPGFFGNSTACGKTLTRETLGVAHKTLPCGSKVVLRYKGRFVRTTVIDRGPYSGDAQWDLTQATAEALHFEATGDIRVAKLAKGSKRAR